MENLTSTPLTRRDSGSAFMSQYDRPSGPYASSSGTSIVRSGSFSFRWAKAALPMAEEVGRSRALFTTCFLTGTPSDLLGLPNGFRPFLVVLMTSMAVFGGRPRRFLDLPVTVCTVALFALEVALVVLVLVLVFGVSTIRKRVRSRVHCLALS